MAALPNFEIRFSGSTQFPRDYGMRSCEKLNVPQLQNLNSKILHKELVMICLMSTTKIL